MTEEETKHENSGFLLGILLHKIAKGKTGGRGRKLWTQVLVMSEFRVAGLICVNID